MGEQLFISASRLAEQAEAFRVEKNNLESLKSNVNQLKQSVTPDEYQLIDRILGNLDRLIELMYNMNKSTEEISNDAHDLSGEIRRMAQDVLDKQQRVFNNSFSDL